MIHLLHPFFVHFSVAFLVAGALAEWWTLFRKSSSRVATLLIIFGTLSLITTIASGYIAANNVELPSESYAAFKAHERNGWFVAGVFVLGLFAKAWFRGQLSPRGRWLYACWITFGALLTIRSAWFGGVLVYEYGVGVGL